MSHITVKNHYIDSYAIKDDLLNSFQLLENNILKLKAMKKEGVYSCDEVSKITNSTINTINVYNQNHNHILKAFDNFHAGRSVADRPLSNFSINSVEIMEHATELKQLSKLCVYFETLKLKIDGTVTKLKNCITNIESPGLLELTYGKLCLKSEAINARSLREFASSSQELRLATETKPNENLHTWQQTPPVPSSANVTINFDVGFGNTLGICCEPDWEKQPIVLSNAGNDWSGNIPTGKNWKFVILKDSQVINWEMTEDRKCEANSSACNYTGQVKFS